jgi:hypothetical protein
VLIDLEFRNSRTTTGFHLKASLEENRAKRVDCTKKMQGAEALQGNASDLIPVSGGSE